ncbi:MAG TPA: hypothetical protein VK776_17915 [Bryobacteraceae bacterium]|nr:hypothetical protein [Bryobacteraceae bacterium]
MKQLVGENAGQLIRTTSQVAIQYYFAFANVASGVDWLPARTPGIKLSAADGQGGQEADSDRASLKRRQPFPNPFNGPVGAEAEAYAV